MTDKNSSSSPYARPIRTERRNSSRHAFTAAATIIEPRSHARLAARTSDLDHMGCYIDTLNPFAQGTTVTLRIIKNNQTFNALARVVYSQMGMGMGLVFNSLDPEQSTIIERWLGKAAPSVETAHSPASHAFLTMGTAYERAPSEVLKYLILMLIQKGVLLELEGQALLEKLLNQPSIN
jgi:hypothetical protein